MIIIKKFFQIVLLLVLFSLDIFASDNRITQTQNIVLNQESSSRIKRLDEIISVASKSDSLEMTMLKNQIRKTRAVSETLASENRSIDANYGNYEETEYRNVVMSSLGHEQILNDLLGKNMKLLDQLKNDNKQVNDLLDKRAQQLIDRRKQLIDRGPFLGDQFKITCVLSICCTITGLVYYAKS